MMLVPEASRAKQAAKADTVSRASLAVMSIKLLKARYMEYINEKNWAGVSECLAPDASVAFEDGKHSFQGREAIIGYLQNSLSHLDVVHAASNPQIRLLSETTASGIWNLKYQWYDLWDNTTLRGEGVYSDRYVRSDGKWLFSFTGFVVVA